MPPEAQSAAPISTGSTGTTTQPDLSSSSGPSGVQNTSTSQTTSTTQSPVSVPSNASPTDWTSSLNESQKLWVQNKGFKQPAEALDSYQNLEKLMGAPKERLVKLPDASDSPEWSEVYEKLGRPKNANEYKFADAPGLKGNPEFTDWAQKQFHSLGLTKTQGETLAAKWNEYAVGIDQKTNAEAVNNLKVEQASLTREWGAAYEQKVKECGKAAQSLGLGQEEVTQLEKALGFGKTMKFLSNIGSKLGEDSFVNGGNGGGFQGALTPERAQAEIDELKKDKGFIAKYTSGDRESFNKMQKLMKFAHPDLPQD